MVILPKYLIQNLPNTVNVMPLQRVQINHTKIGKLSFTFDYGKVYRDGVRIFP